MPEIYEKINEIEKVLMKLSYLQMNTQIQLDRTGNQVDNISKEMKDFKDEMKEDRKKMFKQWGEMSNKLGTIVEDLIVPNVETIGEKYFNLQDCDTFMTSVKKRKPKEKEFDVIAVYDSHIILVEVKSTTRTGYIEDFIEFIKNKEFYTFFPEYKNKKIIPLFASLHIPENAVKRLSGNNILAMAMGDETMDILNPEVVKYL
jgi:hypothetical protein